MTRTDPDSNPDANQLKGTSLVVPLLISQELLKDLSQELGAEASSQSHFDLEEHFLDHLLHPHTVSRLALQEVRHMGRGFPLSIRILLSLVLLLVEEMSDLLKRCVVRF